MSESVLLAICAIALALLTFFGRRSYNARHLTPISPRAEAVVRLVEFLALSAVAHLFYRAGAGPLAFWATISANAFLIYGVTHFADRLIERAANLKR